MERRTVARVAIALVLLLLLLGACAVDTTIAATTNVLTSTASYDVLITYFLVNLNFDDRLVNFTAPIPPNTTWQSSHLVTYSLLPSGLPYHDAANNTLMDYSVLVPSVSVTSLTYEASVSVTSAPGYPTFPAHSANRTAIPDSLQDFTLPTYWWNYTDPSFGRARIDLYSYYSDQNIFEVAGAARNETLQLISNYRASRIRLGATEALQLSLGGSAEYSDVFVALMRSLNLPATRLWSWLVDDVQGGVVTWNGFVQSAFYSPEYGWIPYDVTTSKYVNRPAIGEISDRIITFYIENNLPAPNFPIPLLLSQDQTFFPGGGSVVRSGIIMTTRVSISYIPARVTSAVQLFTLTTTVGVSGGAAILIIIILGVGYTRARARRRAYQEKLDEFEKRLRGVARG